MKGKEMESFSEALGWILHDFKHGSKNYAETTLAIQEAIARRLQLSHYFLEMLGEMSSVNKGRSEQPDDRNPDMYCVTCGYYRKGKFCWVCGNALDKTPRICEEISSPDGRE